MQKGTVWASLILAFILVVTGTAFAEPEFVFKLGHIADPENPYAQGAQKFADLVKEKTGGKVEIQVFPSSQLGNQRDLIEGTQFGTIDFTLTSTAVLGNFLPEVAVFDLPFIFRDVQHAYKALDTVGMEIGAKLEGKGMKVLVYMENGVRHMTNNKHPIRVPEDMKGLKIRVMEQPIYIEMMKALGANPTPMAFGELFTALQQGVVDGQENPAAHIYTARFFEVQKYISLTGHTYSAEPVLVSLKAWNKLSQELQEKVLEAAVEARDWQRNLCRELEDGYWQKIRESGKSEINDDVDKKAFAEATRGVWAKFEDKVGKENIEKTVNVQ
ncbi:DctP family TRAP transporter solute-binding subunit [Aminiphilus circumscriptus]|jgi:tripartite ATP-independent transporter DctP family solute receptor|uniref:TRAP transporter substrate-binding protein n=1 Tax=Aminiphilus circumscriptus TaxID=290732 RepID=UPI000492419E|nr:DctP family TRAP transporter solute-binding subunit [Aminiphilus circumscriptus]